MTYVSQQSARTISVAERLSCHRHALEGVAVRKVDEDLLARFYPGLADGRGSSLRTFAGVAVGSATFASGQGGVSKDVAELRPPQDLTVTVTVISPP